MNKVLQLKPSLKKIRNIKMVKNNNSLDRLITASHIYLKQNYLNFSNMLKMSK